MVWCTARRNSADSVFDSAVRVPPDVPPGVYALQVGILDPRTGGPAVKLAMAGAAPDGWYDMDQATVL